MFLNWSHIFKKNSGDVLDSASPQHVYFHPCLMIGIATPTHIHNLTYAFLISSSIAWFCYACICIYICECDWWDIGLWLSCIDIDQSNFILTYVEVLVEPEVSLRILTIFIIIWLTQLHLTWSSWIRINQLILICLFENKGFIIIFNYFIFLLHFSFTCDGLLNLHRKQHINFSYNPRELIFVTLYIKIYLQEWVDFLYL